MDEFKILTQGVSLNRGHISKDIHFNKVNNLKNDEKSFIDRLQNRINFFGENKVSSTSSPLVISSQHKVKVEDLEEDNVIDEWFYSSKEIEEFRSKHRIYVSCYGEDHKVIHHLDSSMAPLRSFDQLTNYFNVDSWIVDNVKNNLHYTTPSPIQRQAIPCILSGQSVLASAPTGSGKTVAFLLPLLVHLKAPEKRFLRSVIIVPSRELAIQILREFNALQGHKKFKSQLLERQTIEGKEKKRLDVGVTTPLKLVQLLKDKQVEFSSLSMMILDEADRLLDLRFAPQLDEIFSYVDLKQVQILFFSATLSNQVLQLVNSFVFNAIHISIGIPMSAPKEILQKLVFVTNEEGKLSSFRQFVQDKLIKPPALVFMQNIERASELFSELVYDGIFVDVIHSRRSKRERDDVVKAFREKKIWVLICTDVIARGIDFKAVRTVVNWDIPQSSADYIHRVGRTGRAGREGAAITFFTLDDIPYLRQIVNVIKKSGGDVPEWMLKLKKLNYKEKRRFRHIGLQRKSVVGYLDHSQRNPKKRKNG